MIIGGPQYRKIVEICHDWAQCMLRGNVRDWAPSEALEPLNNALDTTLTDQAMTEQLAVMYIHSKSQFHSRADNHLRIASTLIDLAGTSIHDELCGGCEEYLKTTLVTDGRAEFSRLAIELAQALDIEDHENAVVNDVLKGLNIAMIAIEMELDDRWFSECEHGDSGLDDRPGTMSIDPERQQLDDGGED